MKIKMHRVGHNKGVREVLTRDYTHVGWSLTNRRENKPLEHWKTGKTRG